MNPGHPSRYRAEKLPTPPMLPTQQQNCDYNIIPTLIYQCSVAVSLDSYSTDKIKLISKALYIVWNATLIRAIGKHFRFLYLQTSQALIKNPYVKRERFSAFKIG